MDKRVRWLDSIRGLACLIVVLVHIAASGERIKPYTSGCGKIGVWAFMVLSGLFLIRPYLQDGGRTFGVGDIILFLKKRLWKVYPLYLAAVTVYAVFYEEFGMAEAVRSILRHGALMEAWGHFWYMPVVIKFYLAAPLFLLILSFCKKRFPENWHRIYGGFLGLVFAVSALLYPFPAYVENSTSLGFYLPVFVMGMGLAVFWEWREAAGAKGRTEDRKPKGSQAVPTAAYDLGAVACVLGILLLTPPARKVLFGIEPGPFLQNKYLFLGALWCGIFACIFRGTWIQRFLDRASWLSVVGSYSYEIYLIHYIVIMRLMQDHMTFVSRACSTVVITAAAVWVVRYLRYYGARWFSRQGFLGDRRWYFAVPVLGAVFGVAYVRAASCDVIYTDYIRLVNSYLPDVWNPEKFFVPDVLTRIPINYLARIINTTFFHYSVRFDQVLGVLALGASALCVAAYCRFRKIGPVWMLLMMAVLFSLNKWEMMNNGTGWVHFLALAGFYYHYLVLDRVWSGQEKKGDHVRLLLLPWVLILFVAGPYCAAYAAALFLAYPFCMILTYRRKKVWKKEYLGYVISAAVPFFLYLLSNAQAVEDWSGYDVAEGSILHYLFDIPGYFVRFVLKSLSSMAVGQEAAAAVFATNLPYLVLGLFVAAAYLLAFWLQFRHRLYEKTMLPLIFLVSGVINHGLILLSRWKFLTETYGMGSRYALQFQIGIVGILMTFALTWKACRAFAAAFSVLILCGNLFTTYQELGTAPYRKEIGAERTAIALDFEKRTDDELREKFEYRTSRPESGPLVRQALTILKEQNWNVFYEEGQ